MLDNAAQTEVIYQSPLNSVILERLYDGRLIVFKTQGKYSREVLDAWGNAVLSVVESWPLHQPIFFMHDNVEAKLAFTPLAQTWIMRIAQAGKNLSGYYAVALQDTFTTRIFRMLVEGQLRRQLSKQHSRVFLSRDEALHWLASHLH